MIHVYPAPPRPEGDVAPLRYEDYVWLRRAARRARVIHPGELGRLVSHELEAYAEFGRRLADDGLIPLLAAEVLAEGDDVTGRPHSRPDGLTAAGQTPTPTTRNSASASASGLPAGAE